MEQILAKRAEQIKKLADWEIRVTEKTRPMHAKLKPLMDEYKECKDLSRRKTLELQIKPLTICIRWSNSKEIANPPFDTGLVTADMSEFEQMTEEERQVVLGMF